MTDDPAAGDQAATGDPPGRLRPADIAAARDAPAPDAATPYTVSVRALCAFAAREGDLGLRFAPAPSARDGIAGHQAVAARRGDGHRAEVPVELTWGRLRVRGRVDGWDAAAARVEEVKTHRGPVDRIPPHHRALHRAQARTYGWMLCAAHDLPALTVAVVYFDIDRQVETVDEERLDAEALRRHFDALCGRFVDWADRERVHRRARDEALSALAWPFPDFRPGQRHLAAAVFHAVRLGRPLLAQAPTGIGKTLATLFPVLKAMPGHGVDQVAYLTARTPGRALALQGLRRLRAATPAPLRVVSLLAREKACEHPDKACDGASCPLARGFFDRLPAARAAAVAADVAEPADLRRLALDHAVCPYHLSHELARWADVVVADMHHGFDGGALLPAIAAETGRRLAVLVDEAHHLVDRAREMFGAAITLEGVRAARAVAPRGLGAAADRVRRAGGDIARATAEAGHAFQAADRVPAAWLDALRGWTAAVGERLAEDPVAVSGAALQLHVDALRFLALAESLDAHSQFDVTVHPARRAAPRAPPQATLALRNVVPAPFLAPRFAAAVTTVLFSATLAPADHHQGLLGLPDDTRVLDVPSPFDASQLDVRIVRDVSTRWADREASVAPLARLAVAAFRAHPGNHLVFLPSFDYLDRVADRVAAAAPDIPLVRQRRGMSEADREAFVASFREDGAQLGFAVLGGAFGEGIDLPGSRLVGAVVATLGLPQVNPVTESMRRRLDALPPPLGGDGWSHVYQVPGLRKVVQAAGRVIRTPDDRGSVLLVDDRFTRPQVRALLPDWWRPRVVRLAEVLGGETGDGVTPRRPMVVHPRG